MDYGVPGPGWDAHDDSSLQPSIIGITTVLLVLVYASCAARYYCRHTSQMGFGADDYHCLGALIGTTAFGTTLYVSLRYGIGTHYASQPKMKGFVICYLLNVWYYSIATVFTKLSLLAFYCRIFRSKRLVRISWIVGVFTVVYNIVNIIVAMLECRPLSTLWTHEKGKCIDFRLALSIVSLFNVLVDFVILSIPISFVMKLHMDKMRRLQVCAVFLTGFIVCIFAILRLVGFAVAHSNDISYNLVWPGLAAFAEVSVAIVVACLPTMGILFNKTKQRLSAISPPPRYMITKRVAGAPRVPDESLMRSDSESKMLSTDPDNMPTEPTPTRTSFVSRLQQRRSDRSSRRISRLWQTSSIGGGSSANTDGSMATNMQQSQTIAEADEGIEERDWVNTSAPRA